MLVRSQKSHLALIVGSLRGGGTERVCVTLANALVDRGYEVDVVVLNLTNSKYDADLDSRVRLIALNAGTVRTGVLKLWRYLWRTRPNLVLTFAHQFAVAISMMRSIAALPNLRLVARTGNTLSKKKEHADGIWNRLVSPWLTRRWYSSVDVIVAQSLGMAQDLVRHFNVRAEKVVSIPNPIAPHILSAGFAMSREKRNNRILFVGRLDPAKDPLLLLRAFKHCLSDRPDVTLDIVGVGSLEAEMRECIEQLGLVGKVSMHGFRQDVQTFYRDATLTVLCSHFEGLPNCLLESISLGTPVVAVDCEHGPREIIQEGVNGFLVQGRDERLLAETILSALNHAWNGRDVASTVERFQLKPIVDRYERLLSALLES